MVLLLLQAEGKGYTINIALVENGVPIIGIIGYPSENTIWYGYGIKSIKRKVSY